MKPPTISQTMQEIKTDQPQLSPEIIEYLEDKFRWHLYMERLAGAINRTKTQEAKAA